MFKSITECIQRFRKEIRRDRLEQLKQIKRQALLRSISRENMIACFQTCRQQQCIVSIEDIFAKCQGVLLAPFAKQEPMGDESTLIDISVHVQFLRETRIFFEESDGNADHRAMLIQFIKAILQKYTSQQIHKYPEYEQQLYCLVDLVLDDFSSEENQELLAWVSTQEALQLADKVLIFAETISCNTHPQLFMMIQTALASKQQSLHFSALHLLLKILKFSQQQDIFQIYKQYFAIPELIIGIIATKISQMDYQLIDYWAPLLYLFNTFDEARIGYAKTGIIAICGLLICTNTQANIFGGLQMLNLFSQVRCLVDLLLFDEQMEESRMWLVSCLQNNVYKHSSVIVRKSFARMVRGVMMQASKEQLQIFSENFFLKEHSLLAWLEWVLLHDSDQEVKFMALVCVKRLLFENAADCLHLGAIIAHLHNNKIVSHITALSDHPQERIRQLCGDLIDRIQIDSSIELQCL